MKTITREYKVYTLAELSPKARERALEDHRYWNVEQNWYELTIQDFIKRMKEEGYIIQEKDVMFNGFYSQQGSGASFEAEVDLKQWLNTAAKTVQLRFKDIDLENTRANITCGPRNMSVHEGCMGAEIVYEGEEEELETKLADLERMLRDDARDEAKKLYRDLEEEYEYLTSDEVVAESLEVNEYEWLEDGTMFK